ncbi:hypothetical protein T8K17_09285 [Thalassobaculum sp. OXR-137]|uniref:hypothetical protein n=1 Tax=Thalassobaculum sp. OXR-137 TaxID=3100173 RepID=UPI002AC992FA|nr:hypothetical protein [Thalassobaculum sp. OXR-137]WPZ36329.1 hypothetical protein T8K17_09285 [Thalassobaculum sp. OXR-137]
MASALQFLKNTVPAEADADRPKNKAKDNATDLIKMPSRQGGTRIRAAGVACGPARDPKSVSLADYGADAAYTAG